MWPLPYYSEGPGPARDVLQRIMFEGPQRYDPTGQLDLTTVRYQQLTGLTLVRAALDDTLTVVKSDVVYPPDVPAAVTQQRGVSQMDQSQIAATAVALHALHEYPKDHGDGALIADVGPDCPADGKLFPGDIITSVDGTAVHAAAQASKVFDRIPAEPAAATSSSTSTGRRCRRPSPAPVRPERREARRHLDDRRAPAGRDVHERRDRGAFGRADVGPRPVRAAHAWGPHRRADDRRDGRARDRRHRLSDRGHPGQGHRRAARRAPPSSWRRRTTCPTSRGSIRAICR